MDRRNFKFAIQLLEDDAERIQMLIRNPKNSLCISQCKAFESGGYTNVWFFKTSDLCDPFGDFN